MIAAAIVCAAVMANAAQCEWSASYTKDNTDKVGYSAYLFSGDSTAQAATLLAFSQGDFSTLGDNIQTASFTQPNQVFPVSISKKFGDYTVGNWEDMYMVVFNAGSAADATQFQITDVMHVQVPSAGNLPMGFGTLNSVTWNNIQAAPEPTSGLLLLLGVAGLALKRKRA